MNYDTDLTTAQIEHAIGAIEPSWELLDATPADAGHHAVYAVTVQTADEGTDPGSPGGQAPLECYLKATPPGKPPTLDLEARLLAVLGTHTEIPIPRVYGAVDEQVGGDQAAVDEHPSLPAPFHLTTALPGEARFRGELREIDPAVLESIAEDVGRFLADLHALDAVDAYGFLEAAGPTLEGEAPSGDLDSIAVADPTEDWRECLHGWADDTVAGVAETRFADVVPEVEPVLRERIDALEGPFEPVLARVDQALENGLLEDGRLAGMLDWEFTIAATAAYDLECVAWSLAGGPYLFAAGVPDHRELVRESLVAGYRERGRARVIEQFRANRGCYDLLSGLRSMTHLADWFALFDFEDRVDEAAAELRQDVLEIG